LTGESDDFGTTLFRSVFPEGTTLDWESFDTVGWLDNLRHGFHLPVTVRWRDR
jgi:hypothetical protein